MPFRRPALRAILLSMLLVMAMAVPATAITDGARDEGDEYPYVVVVFNFVEIDGVVLPGWGCSGSLIRDDLVLTVAHCTGEFVEGLSPVASWVLFGNNLSDFGQLVPLMFAPDFDVFDPPSVDNLSIEKIVTGVPIAHPQYDNFAEFPQTFDIGVVLLDDPVDKGPYPGIAPLGYLDDLAHRSGRANVEFTLVGHGAQRAQVIGAHEIDGEPVVITQLENEMWRHVGTARLVNLRSASTGGYNLQHTANPGRWSGGTCFGDSGGPVLHDGLIVGLVSFGQGNPMCRGNTSFAYRTDIPTSHDFLAPYLAANND